MAIAIGKKLTNSEEYVEVAVWLSVYIGLKGHLFIILCGKIIQIRK